MSTRIRILVCLPTPLLSGHISQIIQQGLGSRVECHVCEDPYEVYETIQRLGPSVVVVSPNIISGVYLKHIRNSIGKEDIKFISVCLSLFDERIARTFDARLMLSDSSNEIVETIKRLLETESEEELNDTEQALTPREREIVIGVVKGLTNKEIASELTLSTHTVITHRRNIAKKLQIHSPAGLTIYAIVNKLVELKDVK